MQQSQYKTPSPNYYATNLASISNQELVVNKEPDIPLKVALSGKKPEVFVKRRLDYIKKLETVKERLDHLAEEGKDKFLKYIEKKEKA